ncbi:MAG: DUF58 domain-containing protein [Thermogutta sp.]|nr:DUF58 domain-containing protein [Thermogutta sp.]
MTGKSSYRYVEPSALARVKNLQVVARGVVEGFISGLHASPYKGFSVEFAEHREYTAGDDPRHLDYKMLARTERLYVKQYEEETNMRVQVLLDASGSMSYRQEAKISKLEYGCYLTAILAYLMTRQQDSVGLTVFDEAVRLDMPPRSSPRHFNEMMRQLEALRPGKVTRLSDVLHKLANRFKKRCLIVLISDLYEEVDPIIRALHHFRHRKHEVIVFQVLDRAEVEFPFDDLTVFEDLETGERLEVDPHYVRDEYKRLLAEFLSQFRVACTESGIDYVMTDTSVPYDFMLSRYLAKRNQL